MAQVVSCDLPVCSGPIHLVKPCFLQMKSSPVLDTALQLFEVEIHLMRYWHMAAPEDEVDRVSGCTWMIFEGDHSELEIHIFPGPTFLTISSCDAILAARFVFRSRDLSELSSYTVAKLNVKLL